MFRLWAIYWVGSHDPQFLSKGYMSLLKNGNELFKNGNILQIFQESKKKPTIVAPIPKRTFFLDTQQIEQFNEKNTPYVIKRYSNWNLTTLSFW